MRKKIILISICIMFISGSLYSQGMTTAKFLNLPGSVRASSIGGAFLGIRADIDALSYNPAGLSGIDGFAISLLYNKWLFDTNFASFSLVHPFGFGLIGISFRMLNIPLGDTFEFGEKKGEASLNNIALGIGFQRDIGPISLGISAKFVNNDLGKQTGTSAAIDAGILYSINPKLEAGRFNIGVAVRNIGIGMKYKEAKEDLNMEIGGGIYYLPIRYIAVIADVLNYVDKGIEYGGGIELLPQLIITPRAGYRMSKDGGYFTAGMKIGKEFGSTTLLAEYGFQTKAGISQIMELKIRRPAMFEITGRKEKIPFDGKNPTRVAVSEFEAKNVEEELASQVSEWLRIDLAKSDLLIMVAREKMAKLLEEQELQMTGITTSEDAVLIGKILNVKVMVFGSLSKVGSEYYITVKVVDVETGKTEATAEEVSPSKAGLRMAVKRLAIRLDPQEQK